MTGPRVADSSEKREQVAKQCRVVVHLATTLAAIYEDMAKLFEGGHAESILEMNGVRTAELMETLGDILNGIDAVDDDDEWTAPIFEEAQRRWPTAAKSEE